MDGAFIKFPRTKPDAAHDKRTEFFEGRIRLPAQPDRAFRSKSSDLLTQILRAFRYNPLRAHQRRTQAVKIMEKDSPQSRKLARSKTGKGEDGQDRRRAKSRK
jgi:hypothetical protein